MKKEDKRIATIPLSEYESMMEQIAQFNKYKEVVREEISKEYEERINTIDRINRKYILENNELSERNQQLLTSALKMKYSLEELISQQTKKIIFYLIFGLLGWIGFIITLIFLKQRL